MRLLVEGASARAHPRLRAAALGLALRGHDVAWMGPGLEAAAAEAPVRAPGRGDAGGPFEVAIGAGRPLPAVRRGWLAGAGSLVLALDERGPHDWSALDRWAWQSLAGFALAEPGRAADLGERPGPLALDRVGLWSDDPPPAAPAAEHPDCEILERACERIRARRRSAAPRPAVFLDRDGTLIHEAGYLSDPDGVRLLEGVPAALARLKAAGFALVVISNQAGVGRGYYPIARAHAVMARLRRLLRERGVEPDGIYFCPHAPDAGCACRKPGTELLERAAEDHGLALRASAMIGDKRLDVEAGRRAGCRAVLVRTGYGREEERELGGAAPGAGPDWIADDLGAAAAWLLEAPERA